MPFLMTPGAAQLPGRRAQAKRVCLPHCGICMPARWRRRRRRNSRSGTTRPGHTRRDGGRVAGGSDAAPGYVKGAVMVPAVGKACRTGQGGRRAGARTGIQQGRAGPTQHRRTRFWVRYKFTWKSCTIARIFSMRSVPLRVGLCGARCARSAVANPHAHTAHWLPETALGLWFFARSMLNGIFPLGERSELLLAPPPSIGGYTQIQCCLSKSRLILCPTQTSGSTRVFRRPSFSARNVARSCSRSRTRDACKHVTSR